MKQVASIVFINRKKQVLLQLRDDKADLPFPNMWTLPGGTVESQETPTQCIVREMQEEMAIDLKRFFPLVVLINKGAFEEYVFWSRANFRIEDITLTEGQRIQWFAESELQLMHLAYDGDLIMRAFWGYWHSFLPILPKRSMLQIQTQAHR